MKSGFVAIIGRPSAGKSTLMNTLCGEKVAITSPMPQTTRNKIRGIINDERGQLVFIDTPGYHNSDKKLNIHLKDLVLSSLGDAEIVLYVIDGTREPGKEEREIMDILAPVKKPIVTVLNKIDRESDICQETRDFIDELPENYKRVEISALKSTGITELKNELFILAPDGEPLYPEEFYTDQDPGFRISEIIREKAIAMAKQEVPHAIYIDIADMEMRNTKEHGETLWVRAFLTVEKETQKGILVGKKGKTIRTIKNEALKDISKIFSYWVDLDLQVKVNPKWRKRDNLIRRIFQ